MPSPPYVDPLAFASADEFIREGRQLDSAGRLAEAIECYATAIDLAGETGERRALAEALRRLGVVHHTRAESDLAHELCQRSYDIAVEIGASDLSAEALNALAGFDLEHGLVQEALERYLSALKLARDKPALVAQVEHNLGVLANVQGDWTSAFAHYSRSLAASEAAQDIRGRAIACHSLGLISSQQKQWVEAQRYYRACEHLAQQAGELHLLGLARLNLAEVYLALEHPEAGRANAEAALHVFAQLDARRDKAGAHRVLGMIFRDTGRYALAESHLRAAVEIAVSTRCPLTEADAARELAQLYRAMVRTEDSLRCLERARGLYQRLAAWRELDAVEVGIEEMRTAWA